jgi:hypothetical protein
MPAQSGSSIHTDSVVVTKQRAHALYIYWGWNRAYYTRSDIHLAGDNFDFTLHGVSAHDRQSKAGLNPYFYPLRFTIPQTNFRLGYFVDDHWNISFGVDHMKYVVTQNQLVSISGRISDTKSVYNGAFDGGAIVIQPSLLFLEHASGLNYFNIELRRQEKLFTLKRIGVRQIRLNALAAVGTGLMIPRTDAQVLDRERNHQFHLSGFGTGAAVGANITAFDRVFVQGELKGGFIDMPSLRITSVQRDHGSQHFFYRQSIAVLGARFNSPLH